MKKEILEILVKIITFIYEESSNIIKLLTKSLEREPLICKDIKIINDTFR